jgi:hypothetical protein
MPQPNNPDVGFAVGELVVYRDVNENGRLDMHGFDETSVDEVVGSSKGTTPLAEDQGWRYHIVYLTKDDTSIGETSMTGDTKAGYSLVTQGAGGRLFFHAERLDERAEIELILNATPYVQHWTCAETCDVQDERECPEDPGALLLGELGEPQPHGVGWSRWELADGDRVAISTASCSHDLGHDSRYVFQFGRDTYDGCVSTSWYCGYEQSELPDGIELPCTEYQEVNF